MALVGCGSGLPAVCLSNAQLGERVETNDDWIRSRTGIGARHVAGHQVGAAALLAQAIHQQALDHEQGRLGVAGVVEVRGLGDGIEPFAGADRQQVAAQQLGGEGKTLAGVRQIEHGRCHAEFL